MNIILFSQNETLTGLKDLLISAKKLETEHTNKGSIKVEKEITNSEKQQFSAIKAFVGSAYETACKASTYFSKKDSKIEEYKTCLLKYSNPTAITPQNWTEIYDATKTLYKHIQNNASINETINANFVPCVKGAVEHFIKSMMLGVTNTETIYPEMQDHLCFLINKRFTSDQFLKYTKGYIDKLEDIEAPGKNVYMTVPVKIELEGSAPKDAYIASFYPSVSK